MNWMRNYRVLNICNIFKTLPVLIQMIRICYFSTDSYEFGIKISGHVPASPDMTFICRIQNIARIIGLLEVCRNFFL